MNFELSTDSLSRGMLARSSLLSPHEKAPSIKDIRSDIQKLSRLLKHQLKAAQKFHKALVALSRLASPRDGTTNSAEVNDAHLQEFSNALQQCLEKSGVDNIAHAFHLRSLATGRLISSELFDILEDACRRSESCLRTSTHAMSRALMQRLFNYLQTHRHDPDNCLVGQRASSTAKEVAISVATFDALARIREAEQQLAVNELQRSLFTWPTLTQDQICVRALALAAAARDAWQTGALVMVPDGTTQQLCFARFSGRRVGDQLGVFLTPSEEKDELFNSAHVFPVLPSLLRQLSTKATTLVNDPFTRFQEKEIIAAERRIQRFLQLYGFDWDLCESLSAVREAIASMKKSSSSSSTRSSSRIDSGAIWVQTDDNGDRLLSVGDSYGVLHNLDILMADNNTGPKLESVVDYVRMAALTAARRFIATIRERFDPSVSSGQSQPAASPHPDTYVGHSPSSYARRSSLCSVQSVDSIDMQSALLETESYKPFGPTFMSSIRKLELHCETMSNFVYDKFEKNRQEHQEALVLINNRCKRMKSGRDKEDLNVWWSSEAKKMTLAFLESHGVDLDALEDDFMLSPPKDMHAVRRNYRLLRRALDADNDPLRTRQLLDAVRAKIYPRIDAFVDDALASVALTLRVPRSIFVRERHKPEAFLEILRRKLNKDTPTEMSLRRGSLIPSLGSAKDRLGSSNSSAHDSPRRAAAHNARRRSSMLGDHVAGGDMLLNGRRRMSATDVEERRALAGRRKSMGTLSGSLCRTDHSALRSSRFSESRSYMSGTSHTTSDEEKDGEFSSAHDSPARSFSTPAAANGTTPPPRRRDSHTVRVPPPVLRQSDADWNRGVHRSVSSRSGGGAHDDLSSISSSTTSSTFGSGTDGGVIDHASPVPSSSPRIVSCSSSTSSTHCTTSNDSSDDDNDDDDNSEKNSEQTKEEVMVDASSSATISNASTTTFLLPAHARRSTSDRQCSAARTSPAPRRHSNEDKATPTLHNETASTESTTPMTTPPSTNKQKPQSPTRVKHRHRVGNTKTTLQASSSAGTVTHRRHRAASTALLLSNSNVSAKSRKRRVRRRSGDSLPPTANQSVLRKGSRDDSDVLFTSLTTRRRLALMTHEVDMDDDDSSRSSAAARSSASASSLKDSGSLSPRILATAQYRRRSRDGPSLSRWGVKPASVPNEIEMSLHGALSDASHLASPSTAAAVAAAAAAVDETVQRKPRHNSDEFQSAPKFQLMTGLRRRSTSYDESHIDTDDAPEWCHELLADVGYLLEMRQLEAAGVSDRLGVVPVSGIVIGRITRYFREHQNALELYDDGHASISTDDDVLPHDGVEHNISDKHADDVPHSPRRSLLRGLSNKDNPDKRKKVPLGRYVLASLSLFGLRSSRHKVDDATPRTLTQELSPRHPHSPEDARRLSPADDTEPSPPDTVEADTTTFGMRSAMVDFDEDSGEHAENEALSRRDDARRLLNSATHVSMVGASDEEAEDDDDGASAARSKRRATSHRRTKDKHSMASILSASAARRRTSPDAMFGLAAMPASPMRNRSLSNARDDDDATSIKRSPVSARRHRRVPSVDDGTTGSGSVPKLADEVDAAVDDVTSKKKRKPLRRRSRHLDHAAAEDLLLKSGAVDISRASSDTNNRRRRAGGGHAPSSTADILSIDASPDVVDTPSPPVSPTRNTRRRRQTHTSKRSYKAHTPNSLRRHSGDMSAIRLSSDGLSYEVSLSSSSSHGVHTPPRIQRRRSSVDLQPNGYSISPPHVHGSMTERPADHRHQLHSSPRRSTLRHSHERDKAKAAKKKK